jgi:hypothetical protein
LDVAKGGVPLRDVDEHVFEVGLHAFLEGLFRETRLLSFLYCRLWEMRELLTVAVKDFGLMEASCFGGSLGH